MDRVGPVTLRRQRHRFGALCRSILSQQLGAAAARTIHRRFLKTLGSPRRPDPERVLSVKVEDLRGCGISGRKVEYLRGLAQAFAHGALGRVRWSRLPDDEVIRRLTSLAGIGVWTAEMFLIFSLGRRDVFSLGDLALREGVQRVEGRRMKADEIVTAAKRWAPYRSVACLYLWKIAHHKHDELPAKSRAADSAAR
jgi:DNA-3-methyladenine glycosylase II